MGNDYSFVLYVPQERMWDVLQSVSLMSPRSENHTEIVFPDRKITVPFSSGFKTEPIVVEDPFPALSFDTSLCFEMDEVLEDDLEDLIRYGRDLGEDATREDYLDDQGRMAIGFIYLSIDPEANRRFSRYHDAKPVARFTFTAATDHMSDLFEQSPSMQQTFAGLTAAHQGESCFLDREEKPSLLLWLEGEPMKEELPFHYLSVSYCSPDDIRVVMRGIQIDQDLQQRQKTTSRLELLSQSLQDPDPLVRATAISSFGNDTPECAPLLIQALHDEDSGVRFRAAAALGERKEMSAVPFLIALLGDPSAGVRRAACDALGCLKDKATVEPLIRKLQDEASGVRGAAVEALGALRDRRAVEPLIRALEGDDDDIRLSVIIALGYLRDPRAVEPLCQRLALETGGKKIFIANALGAIRDKSAIPALSRLLVDEDGLTTSHAVEALGKIREPESVAILRNYLDDRDWGVKNGVRNVAEKALRKLTKSQT